jgi:hypothetical protein
MHKVRLNVDATGHNQENFLGKLDKLTQIRTFSWDNNLRTINLNQSKLFIGVTPEHDFFIIGNSHSHYQ